MFQTNQPLEEAYTLPTKYYSLNSSEEKTIFQNWIAVGYIEQVKNQGDYFAVEINGKPIVVLNNEGQIKAYYNVCSHHAATIMADSGNCTKLRCPYHGWTYDLNGDLRGVPEFDGVCNFKREWNGLKPVKVDTFGPLIFICTAGPLVTIPSLKEYLSPITTEGEDKFVIPNYIFCERRKYTLNCNWKVFVDNYLDGGYHVNYIHEKLASAINYKEYRNELYDNAVLQIAPLKESDDEAIRQTRTGDCAYYWWVYPNLMINVYGQMMDTNIVFPLGPNKCEVWIDFFHSSQIENVFSTLKQSIDVSEVVQQEDIDICERVQKGLNSGVYQYGRYSVLREGGMYHFHKKYYKDMTQ